MFMNKREVGFGIRAEQIVIFKTGFHSYNSVSTYKKLCKKFQIWVDF